MTPWQFVQYVALEQLDAFAGDGVARTMGGFAKLADERDEYADLMFQSYAEGAEDLDPADWGEEAREQSLDYYQLLLNLRQSILNLLAAGLYHLYEQHRDTVIDLLKQDGRTLPPLQNLNGWTKVEELRLLANTVKHAGGSSANKLEKLRPDLFVPPRSRRGSPPEKVHWPGQIDNPLGGTDLFVTETDIQNYRDAIRDLWESLRPVL